jgi:hypothetical protein
MAWRIEGTYFENCNCDMVCPCSTSGLTAPGDQERCDVALAFHVASGQVDGVDVSGLTVAVVADTPALMSEGGWRVGMFMDAAASPEQAEALSRVFSGQSGGPMAALGPLIAENLGSQTLPIQYLDDGRRHTVRRISRRHAGGRAGDLVLGRRVRPDLGQHREERLLGALRLVGLSPCPCRPWPRAARWYRRCSFWRRWPGR